MGPKAIIQVLNPLRPVYRPTAAYGHFGRAGFSWEKTDRAAQIAADLLGGKFKGTAVTNGSGKKADKKKAKKTKSFELSAE